MGWAAFVGISPNVEEEGAMKEDTGTQDTPYTEVGAVTVRTRIFSHPQFQTLSVCVCVTGHTGGAAGVVCRLSMEV